MTPKELDRKCSVELKLLRKKHNLSQTEMFERLDLDRQQQYSELENNKKHFTDEIILKICTLFNVSIFQFTNNQTETSSLNLFLSDEDYDILENSNDPELKISLYKKLLLESKIENIELQLKVLYKDFDNIKTAPSKHNNLRVII